MSSSERREQRMREALYQLMKIRRDLQSEYKPIDQNLKSWINAITFCLSDSPMILGDPN